MCPSKMLKLFTFITRAGEPEPEAVEPSPFSGAGAGTFLNISLEREQQIFY